MGKVVATVLGGKTPVVAGDYLLLCRPNRQWNIHRVASILHRSEISGVGSDIPGTGLGPDAYVLLNDYNWVCPYRPRNDKLFLQRISVARGYGARSDDETFIREDCIQGVIKGTERAENVAEAMSNAQLAYDMTAKQAHDMFMFTMALVRSG